MDRLSQSLDRAYEDLDEKDNIVAGLQKQIEALQSNITNLNKQVEANNNQVGGFSFTSLSRDAKVRFHDLEYFGYSKMLQSKDFINIDTVALANVKWSGSLNDSLRTVKEAQLSKWLKSELNLDTIIIKRN
jgi:hypothetical protein